MLSSNGSKTAKAGRLWFSISSIVRLSRKYKSTQYFRILDMFPSSDDQMVDSGPVRAANLNYSSTYAGNLHIFIGL
jgi:hypothetical protein